MLFAPKPCSVSRQFRCLGRRLLRQLRIDGGKPARRAVDRHVRLGFWSHDIGGFENTARAGPRLQALVRLFGPALSGTARCTAAKSYRVPWALQVTSPDRCAFTSKCR